MRLHELPNSLGRRLCLTAVFVVAATACPSGQALAQSGGGLTGVNFMMPGYLDYPRLVFLDGRFTQADYGLGFSASGYAGDLDGDGVYGQYGRDRGTTIAGPAAPPTQNIASGTYRLNTSYGGDFNVSAPGTLAGNGVIYGNVYLGGTMAPGNSIGMMTINGNYTTSSGSIQQIEINSAGTMPTVNNDLVVVNGNVILNGGTVSVVTAGGGFHSGMQYAFLAHTGTQTGTFDGITTNSAFLSARLVYDMDSIAFVISRNTTQLRDVAVTYNQQQVASYLDRNNPAVTGDGVALFDEILSRDAASARAAFDQLSGAVYGSAAQANLQNVTQMYRMLGRNSGNYGGVRPSGNADVAHLGPIASNYRFAAQSPDDFLSDERPMVVPSQTAPAPSRRVWNAWSTSYGSANASSDSIGTYAAGGTMLAIDRALNEAWNVGGFGAYNYVSLHSTSPADQRVRQNGGQFGAYLRRDDGANHLMSASAVGFDGYDSIRRIQIAGINGDASGNYAGWQYSTYLEYGRRFEVKDFDLDPYIALQYAHSRQNEFTETGAGTANLQVEGVDTDSLRGILGSRYAWDGVWRGRLLRPELQAAWIHEYLDDATTFNSVFAGVGGTSFATQGANFGRDWGLFGGGLNFALTDRILLAGQYDMQANTRSMVHLGSAAMQVRW